MTAGAPLYDFTAADGVQHTIWRAAASRGARSVEAFARFPRSTSPTAIIARRAPRARAAALQTQVGGGIADAETFIAVAFPDDQMQILPYNRTVKDLAGRTPEAVPRRAAPELRRDGRPGHATAQGRGVDVPRRALVHARPRERPPEDDSARAASTSRSCSATCSSRCSASATSAPTSAIDFVGGARGTEGARARGRLGRAAVAFSMYPVTIDDLMAISDAGGIMPPKSTWFEPKLRDGLLVHLI